MQHAAPGAPIVAVQVRTASRYILLLAGVFILAFCAIQLGTAFGDIRPCNAAGYDDDHYLAYCNDPGYASYEHGALYFAIEARSATAMRDASVLFLGNSRMQYAFSTTATRDFFAARGRTHFLAGFGYSENALFAKMLLTQQKPRAKLVVINADPFFVNVFSPPAIAIATTPWATRLNTYRKWVAQGLHRFAATSLAGTVLGPGETAAYFRSRTDGSWVVDHYLRTVEQPTKTEQPVDPAELERFRWVAVNFRPLLPAVSACTVLVFVPGSDLSPVVAREIAAQQGFTFLPLAMDDLRTVDGSHLDRPSAERWSAAILEKLAPVLGQCVGDARL